MLTSCIKGESVSSETLGSPGEPKDGCRLWVSSKERLQKQSRCPVRLSLN